MHVSDLHNRTRQWLRVKLYQDYCIHLRMFYVFMTQNGACLCSTFGQRCLWGGGNMVEHKNYKRVSAWRILCQDMMLDDKILLKCEGGGLGYEMPNGFPQLLPQCGVYSILRANWGLQCRFWLRNISPLCHPIPSAGIGVFWIVFWMFFSWNYPFSAPFPVPKDCVKDSGVVNKLWNCFNSFSCGVFHRRICIQFALSVQMLLFTWLMGLGPLFPFTACQSMSQLWLLSIDAGGGEDAFP